MDFCDVETSKEQIYRSILFKQMERDHFEKILPQLNGKMKTYDKGEVVIMEESRSTEIGILIRGELCKVQFYGDGTEQMMQKLKESFVVGLEVAVSKKKTSPYSIYVSEDATIFWFSVRCMEEEGILSEKDRIFLYRQASAFLANEEIREYRKIEILSAKGAREKIERYLRIQMMRYNSVEFDIDFNREQLSNYLGLNRSVLSHELKKMEQDGILEVRKNHFLIRNLT